MTVISDLDGTLLSREGAVPGQLQEVVSLVESLELKFVIATSRPLDDVCRILGGSRRGFVAVLNDGSQIIDIEPTGNCRVLDELMLSSEDVNVVMKLAAVKDILPFAFTSHSAESPNLVVCPPLLIEERKLLNLLTPGRPYYVSDTLTAYISAVMSRRTEIRAIAYFVREQYIQEIRSFITGALDRTRSVKLLDYPDTRCEGYQWLELVPAQIGKRGAIERLLKRSLVDRPLIGFGNGTNDVEFLETCDYALCPSDAEPEVLEVVDEVAPVGGGASFCAWINSRLPEIYDRVQF